MENLGIILCSTVSKTDSILAASNIEYISLSTNFKEFEIKSGEVTLPEYFAKVEELNEVPKTSQPSTGDIIQTIENAVSKYSHVIIVTIGELLSGTHQNVVLALDSLDNDIKEKVKIVNSGCIAMSETIIYDELVKKQDEMSFEELVEHLDRFSKELVTYAVPGSMKFLKMSGRVNTSQLVLGTIANIKTLIKANYEDVSLYHKGRGYKSILKKIEEEIELYNPSKAYYTSILEEQKIHDAMMDLFKKHNIEVIETKEADIVAGTHFGPLSYGFTLIKG